MRYSDPNLKSPFLRQVLEMDFTVWKFQDFSVIHILREIKFGESRSPKTAICAIFGDVKFVNLVTFSLQKVLKLIKIKLLTLKMC